MAGMKLPCAVIQGPNGIQRVLREHGITRAILGDRSGASKRLKKAAAKGGALLPIFLAPGQLERFIDNELQNGPLAPPLPAGNVTVLHGGIYCIVTVSPSISKYRVMSGSSVKDLSVATRSR